MNYRRKFISSIVILILLLLLFVFLVFLNIKNHNQFRLIAPLISIGIGVIMHTVIKNTIYSYKIYKNNSSK